MSPGRSTRNSRNDASISRAYKDLRPLPEDAEIEDIIREYNNLANTFNFLTKFMSISNNFDGNISTVVLPATTQVQVQHLLGVTPKYRLILRQEGNGVISDIPSGWNDKYITLLNNGSVEVRITILIARE